MAKNILQFNSAPVPVAQQLEAELHEINTKCWHASSILALLAGKFDAMSLSAESPEAIQAALDLENACEVVAGLIKDVPGRFDELLAKALKTPAQS